MVATVALPSFGSSSLTSYVPLDLPKNLFASTTTSTSIYYVFTPIGIHTEFEDSLALLDSEGLLYTQHDLQIFINGHQQQIYNTLLDTEAITDNWNNEGNITYWGNKEGPHYCDIIITYWTGIEYDTKQLVVGYDSVNIEPVWMGATVDTANAYNSLRYKGTLTLTDLYDFNLTTASSYHIALENTAWLKVSFTIVQTQGLDPGIFYSGYITAAFTMFLQVLWFFLEIIAFMLTTLANFYYLMYIIPVYGAAIAVFVTAIVGFLYAMAFAEFLRNRKDNGSD